MITYYLIGGLLFLLYLCLSIDAANQKLMKEFPHQSKSTRIATIVFSMSVIVITWPTWLLLIVSLLIVQACCSIYEVITK